MHDTTPAMVIAVDGPAAAGKTTTSLVLARTFGLDYLESGKAFRVIACEALRRRRPVDDPDAIGNLCDELFADGDSGSVLASARYTPLALRSPDVTAAVPVVARMPDVRRHITALIHQWAAQHRRCIIEGRDIGTAVFPAAPVKFYLTATTEIRAARRVRQEPGHTYDIVLADVRRRDLADMTRTIAPLTPANDAIEIDTSRLTIRQVLHRMSAVCRTRGIDNPTPDNHISPASPATPST
ncbi:(d)CMP kinase [Amycolatopsis roodepoortensis]|uniref:(d)CMP kinase n=1 Tax=Amycolatopsis roodepoortensis TaxID=700274 RepID=UPI00214CFC61|nr:(d)CMP kinase [Amycolatopsis roodepoortensis]UUV32226.1 (d)CMP kinase [Amycolatopsis roodepoortensis]